MKVDQIDFIADTYVYSITVYDAPLYSVAHLFLSIKRPNVKKHEKALHWIYNIDSSWQKKLESWTCKEVKR